MKWGGVRRREVGCENKACDLYLHILFLELSILCWYILLDVHSSCKFILIWKLYISILSWLSGISSNSIIHINELWLITNLNIGDGMEYEHMAKPS